MNLDMKKKRARSAKSLIFTFSFVITAFTSLSSTAVPVMAAGQDNTPKTVATADRDVWESATGSCYHSKNNCGKMDPSRAKQLKESKAKAKGLKKCKKCCKW